ncbi:hypothetical protein ASU35_11225 [Acetivibrio ethanolgignens]|uniref:Pyruvate formate-lyase-activating enzyme n=2 Tax=Acetivibrio ethanolgignens TaxID=290052 RepID=A0A0V8QE61_9FIRM|nr:pyruvate formate-lyase-activating protein [Acetivibrio ethanolgignens]KSV58863.1 hypothetical protein ASU35_11225 [Acetivibrio ethanolgignens]
MKETKNMSELTGRIHSFESCGTVDGPGIRFVVFLQGCPLRCQYCHNADTWNPEEGRTYTVEELLTEIVKYKSYMRFSGGGVTLTGGEPLMQAEFVKEVFKACKEQEIHTALDTSGFLFHEKTREALTVTDLVLLDIKNFDPERYHEVTGAALEPTLQFLNYTREKNIPVWVRYVLVPSLTDNLEAVEAMAEYLKEYPNVERIELLPFHKMGEFKWKERNLSYQLKEVEEPTQELVSKVRFLLEKSGKLVQ